MRISCGAFATLTSILLLVAPTQADAANPGDRKSVDSGSLLEKSAPAPTQDADSSDALAPGTDAVAGTNADPALPESDVAVSLDSADVSGDSSRGEAQPSSSRHWTTPPIASKSLRRSPSSPSRTKVTKRALEEGTRSEQAPDAAHAAIVPEPAPKPLLKSDARCEMRMPAYEHTVLEGEHLGTIAGRYGVLVRDILAINPSITDANKIRIGQAIVVCPEIAPKELLRVEHKLAQGETLSHVALRYGASVDELLAFQGGAVTDPNKVRAGTVLVVWTQGDAVAGYRSDDEIELEAPPPAKTADGRRWKQMTPGTAWSLKRPDLAYGTKATVEHMTHALERYAKKAGKGPAVQIGDISRRGGGKLFPHLSHRHGVDVDIGFVMKGDQSGAKSFRSAVQHPESIDVHRTWLLLESILVGGQVRYVFLDYEVQQQLYEHAVELGVPKTKLDNWFQYPRGRGRNHGIVRHWRHHRGHLHVRFREG